MWNMVAVKMRKLEQGIELVIIDLDSVELDSWIKMSSHLLYEMTNCVKWIVIKLDQPGKQAAVLGYEKVHFGVNIEKVFFGPKWVTQQAGIFDVIRSVNRQHNSYRREHSFIMVTS